MGTWNRAVTATYDFQNMSHVFPLMHRAVGDFLHMNRNLSRLSKVIVFGSSVTSACNPWSDVDIYVEGVERGVDRLELPSCREFDVIYEQDLKHDTGRLRKEIFDKGVVVFERDAT